jgi:rubrerythrin
MPMSKNASAATSSHDAAGSQDKLTPAQEAQIIAFLRTVALVPELRCEICGHVLGTNPECPLCAAEP